MPPAYDTDLAYVHHAGFPDFAEHGAATLIELLRCAGKTEGLLVELGCGSGIASAELCASGFEVIGVDISHAMIALAAKRAPLAEFRVASWIDFEPPHCAGVAAIGEVFNYQFDERHSSRQLRECFERVFRALEPGGLLMFDVATPGRVPPNAQGQRRQQSHRLTDDWAVLATAEEDASRGQLTRRITTFRREEAHFRRADETHHLQLFEPEAIEELLTGAGFQVERLEAYRRLDSAGFSEVKLHAGLAGFVARKT